MRNEHEAIVTKTKTDFDECVRRAKNPDNREEVYVFDLQRALETPLISTSEAFYKRQLWSYNLCIYDESRNKGCMYVWNETIASRGSQEIASCLFKHFSNYLPKNTTKITLFSDSCGGQNRNVKITMMLKYFFAQKWENAELQIIDQKYFVSGHSYNSCDRCFGIIEKQKRITENIYVPDHWYNLIVQAKKSEPKFTVVKMESEDFFSSKQLEKLIVNRKQSIDGKHFSWLKLQYIRYDRKDPFILYVKEYSESDNFPFLSVSLQKRNILTFDVIDLEQLYEKNGQKISIEKYEDLKSLLKYIPQKYHAFYNSIKHSNSKNTYKNNLYLDLKFK